MATSTNKPRPGGPQADQEPDAAALGQLHGPADAAGPGADEVKAAMDTATAQGFFGNEVDPTPNEHYTVDGVTSGKPTPETDADAHDAALSAVPRNPHRNR